VRTSENEDESDDEMGVDVASCLVSSCRGFVGLTDRLAGVRRQKGERQEERRTERQTTHHHLHLHFLLKQQGEKRTQKNPAKRAKRTPTAVRSLAIPSLTSNPPKAGLLLGSRGSKAQILNSCRDVSDGADRGVRTPVRGLRESTARL